MTRTLLRISVFALAALTGCSDSPGGPGPAPPTLAALEAVPFDEIAPGKLVFHRRWGSTAEGPSKPDAVYVIDGDGRRSWGALFARGTFFPTAVAASPDGRRVLVEGWGFFQPGDLSVAALEEGALGQYTLLATLTSSQRAWTPDGEQIVFSWTDNQRKALYIQRPVANAERTLLFPTVLPGGASSTCERAMINIRGQISVAASGAVVMACLDTAIHVLDPAAAVTRVVYLAPGGTDASGVRAPAWSPDGRRIAFIEVTLGAGSESDFAIRVMDADGANSRTLATLRTAWYGGRDETLCWMPDGERIAFEMPQGDTSSFIYIVRASGGVPVQVTSSPGAKDQSVSCTA